MEYIDKLLKDKATRVEASKNSLYIFAEIYFHKQLHFEFDDMHLDIIRLLEDEELTKIIIGAFKGSGKTTLITIIYSLWSCLGKQNFDSVLILLDNSDQRELLEHLFRTSVQNNKFLTCDFGKFKLNKHSLNFELSNKKISFKKLSEFRHKSREYDMVITDNLFEFENSDNTKFVEVLNLFTDHYLKLNSTKVVVCGNILKTSSFILKLESTTSSLRDNIKFVHYPLFDDNGKCLWKDKYDRNTLKILKSEVSENDFKIFYLHQTGEERKVATWQYEYMEKYGVDLITASILAFSGYKKKSQILSAIESINKDKKVTEENPVYSFRKHTVSFPKNKDSYYI
jgi:hypothetical protein